MCVKDFQGYSCGHCSVPILRQCPLSLSNPHFPPCAFPAERPIFIDDFCHPCSRVVWNAQVLKEEEEHRGLHQRGECQCEVIFDQEERDRRSRTVPIYGGDNAAGKGKERASEFVNDRGYAAPPIHSRQGGETSFTRGNVPTGHTGHRHANRNDRKSHRTSGSSPRTKNGGNNSSHRHRRESAQDFQNPNSQYYSSEGSPVAQRFQHYSVASASSSGHLTQTGLHQGQHFHDPNLVNVSNGVVGFQSPYHNQPPQAVQLLAAGGMKWFAQSTIQETPGPALPPLPPVLHDYSRGPGAITTTSHEFPGYIYHRAKSEPTKSRKKMVSPRTVGNSISDSSSERDQEKGSSAKVTNGYSSKRLDKGKGKSVSTSSAVDFDESEISELSI